MRRNGLMQLCTHGQHWLRNQTQNVGHKAMGGNQAQWGGAIRQPSPLPRDRQYVELSRPPRGHQLLRILLRVKAARVNPA